MTQQDQEILQLAQRIQFLSGGGLQTAFREEEELSFRLAKIQEIANALVPRIEAKYATH